MVDAESGSPPLAKDIFAAIGGSSNGALMFASIPSSAQVASIDLCRGDKVACMSGSGSQLGRLVAAPTLKVSGRSIFRSEQYVNIQNGETLTLVLRGETGAAIDARSMKTRAK
jgi:hypothetical protein